MRISDWSSDVCSSDLPICRVSMVVSAGVTRAAYPIRLRDLAIAIIDSRYRVNQAHAVEGCQAGPCDAPATACICTAQYRAKPCGFRAGAGLMFLRHCGCCGKIG